MAQERAGKKGSYLPAACRPRSLCNNTSFVFFAKETKQPRLPPVFTNELEAKSYHLTKEEQLVSTGVLAAKFNLRGMLDLAGCSTWNNAITIEGGDV